MITRAVAAGLRHEYRDSYQFPLWQKAALLLLGYLPQAAGRTLIQCQQKLGGIPKECLEGLRVEQLVDARIRDYDPLMGRVPSMVFGVGQGGATAHLALALSTPFLPQAFVLTLKGGSIRGSSQEYFERSARLALRIAGDNPELMTIQHFDPIHDGWLTRSVNHLRVKLIRLPEGYKQFILAHLEPGGDIVYLDGQATWLRYRVGERSIFQVGGWGDISAEEYLEGSSRIKLYCQKVGMSEVDWQLKGYPLERGPESEWGSEPGMGEALADFALKVGYHFTRIAFPHPEQYSQLAFLAQWELLKKLGRVPAGVLIEMFTQFDATAVLESGLLPLWLIYNTKDSYQFLKKMAPAFPQDKPVFFSPLSTFSETPDLVSYQKWVELLEGFNWSNIGTRPSYYPSDPQALVRWSEPLRSWCKQHSAPILDRISVQALADLAGEICPGSVTNA